jgi:hypothetical protein
MKLADEICRYLPNVVISSPYDVGLPNSFVGDFEADYIKLSKSQILTEYEIKISKSDFNNDFNKKCGKTNKHDLIKDGKRCNRFYFVCPKNLISISEIPDYCGLIYYENKKFIIIKNAPLIIKRIFIKKEDLFYKISLREQSYRIKLLILQSKYKKLLNDKKSK